MGEPTYEARVGTRRIVEVVDGQQASENAQALRDYQNFATIRLPGNLLNPNVSDKEFDVIVGTGAPDAEYNSAPIGSFYFDSTNGVHYVKNTAAGSIGWSYLTQTMTYAGNPTNNVTPLYAGCFCYDIFGNDMYVSVGTAAANWELLTDA